MEEKNNKKYSMFYAIFGIITLIVAIIGSTIAYFSVAVEGNNNKTVITGQTAQGILLKLEVEKVTTGATGNLIPLDTMEPWYLADKSQLQDALGNTTSCVDNAGSTVCQVYKVTISGEEFGNSTIRALGTLNLTSNASDMKWKVLTNATTDSTNTANGVGTASSINGSAGVALSNAKKSDTYYIAIWLEETNTDQSGTSNNETGKNYTGTVHFDAVDASGTVTNLTATFSNNGSTTSESNAVNYITNLYLNNKSKTEKNGQYGYEVEYQYAETVNLMNDRLGTMSVGADDGNIRYYGANPSNYVDIGDVYEEETEINHFEENKWFLSTWGITSQDSCFSKVNCTTLVDEMEIFYPESECQENLTSMFGTYETQGICGTETVPAGTPKSLYRIIGVFKDVELADGSKKDLIKVIRNYTIGEYSWDQSSSDVNEGYGINEWSQADLMKLLNPNHEKETVGGSLYWNSTSGTCYGFKDYEPAVISCDFTNKGLNTNAKNKIETVKWNLGGRKSGNTYPHIVYEFERLENLVQDPSDRITRTPVWTGKIALAYPSDYGYAADLSICDTMHSESCEDKWIYPVMSSYNWGSWLLTPNSTEAYGVWRIGAGGSADSGTAFIGLGVSPVFYLDPELDIVSGEGTESSPYVLG